MIAAPTTLELLPPALTNQDDALAVAHALLAGQLAPTSIAIYARDVRAYLRFATTSAAALDAATLARWRAHLAANTSLSPHTINRMLAAVKRLIKEAAIQGHLDQDTAKAFAQIGGASVVGSWLAVGWRGRVVRGGCRVGGRAVAAHRVGGGDQGPVVRPTSPRTIGGSGGSAANGLSSVLEDTSSSRELPRTCSHTGRWVSTWC